MNIGNKVEDLADSLGHGEIIETTHQKCGDLLYGQDGFRARCIQKWGTEHSHNDMTAELAVERSMAVRVQRSSKPKRR